MHVFMSIIDNTLRNWRVIVPDVANVSSPWITTDCPQCPRLTQLIYAVEYTGYRCRQSFRRAAATRENAWIGRTLGIHRKTTSHILGITYWESHLQLSATEWWQMVENDWSNLTQLNCATYETFQCEHDTVERTYLYPLSQPLSRFSPFLASPPTLSILPSLIPAPHISIVILCAHKVQ